MDAGRFGLCEACNDPIETDRLLANPLVRLCLDHLTRAEATALEHDLELARSVQRGMLPSSPYAGGSWRMAYQYRPAGIVSGDYCDVVVGCRSDRYFLLGDVAGKGVAASMLMTLMHGMFRALIPTGLAVGQLVERASTLFCESTLPSHYATLAVVRALDDGSVEICNAGHVTPMAVQQGHVVPLRTGSLPLGMFCAVRSFGRRRKAPVPLHTAHALSPPRWDGGMVPVLTSRKAAKPTQPDPCTSGSCR